MDRALADLQDQVDRARVAPRVFSQVDHVLAVPRVFGPAGLVVFHPLDRARAAQRLNAQAARLPHGQLQADSARVPNDQAADGRLTNSPAVSSICRAIVTLVDEVQSLIVELSSDPAIQDSEIPAKATAWPSVTIGSPTAGRSRSRIAGIGSTVVEMMSATKPVIGQMCFPTSGEADNRMRPTIGGNTRTDSRRIIGGVPLPGPA